MLVLLPAVARADTTSVQSTWRLLDYVAVDYGGAVHDGRVISQAEYAEMLEKSEEHTSELQSLMRISYAVFCLKKKNKHKYASSNTTNSCITKTDIPTIMTTTRYTI